MAGPSRPTVTPGLLQAGATGNEDFLSMVSPVQTTQALGSHYSQGASVNRSKSSPALTPRGAIQQASQNISQEAATRMATLQKRASLPEPISAMSNSPATQQALISVSGLVSPTQINKHFSNEKLRARTGEPPTKTMIAPKLMQKMLDASRHNNLTWQGNWEEMVDAFYAGLPEGCKGMPLDHIQQLALLAQAKNCVFAFRGVQRFAHDLVDICATKPMHVKQKTCREGPAAGYLVKENNTNAPIGYEYRKLSIGSQALMARIPSIETHVLKPTGMFNFSHKGQSYWAVLEHKTHPARWNIQHQTNGTWEPIEVLHHSETALPVTSDYDLLTFAYAKQNDEHNTQPTQPIQSLEEFREYLKLSKGVQRDAEQNSQHSAGQSLSFPKEGNASPFELELISQLNNALKRPENNPLVHHGAECHNPATETKGLFPALMFLPFQENLDNQGGTLYFNHDDFNIKGCPGVLLLNNMHDLAVAYMLLACKGMKMRSAARWGLGDLSDVVWKELSEQPGQDTIHVQQPLSSR